MKTLSKWATRHPWPARLILVILHCVNASVAFTIGLVLLEENIRLHSLVPTFCMIVFLVLILRYPSRKRIPFALRYLYQRAKVMDFALLFTSFCMIVSFTNQEFAMHRPASRLEMMIMPAAPQSSKHELRKERKEQRKEIRKHVRAMLKEVKGNFSIITAIIISSIFLTFLITAWYGILALSCSLSCSGAEGLAALVGFGGTGLLIYLSILGFRWIWSKDKSSTQPAS